MHQHDHGTSGARGRAVGVALGLNTVLLVVQVAGALTFGSLALLADSVHQLSDVISLIVAMVALGLSQRPNTSSYTYGLRRADVFGALINAVLLLAAAGWITVEAFRRIGEPHEIDGTGVIVLALVGLAVNAGSAWWVSRVAGESLNLRGAVIHLAADAAGSVAVLASGIAIVVWDATWVDPTMSLLIAALVLWQGFDILRKTAVILMEGTPHGVDLQKLETLITDQPGVEDVHHLHIWSLDSETQALTAHVVIGEESLHRAQVLANDLEELLENEGIHHSTLAVECHDCTVPLDADHSHD